MSSKDSPDGADATDFGAPLATTQTKRSRWATRKLTVRSSGLKRLSLVARKAQLHTSRERKRTSAGSETLRQDAANPEGDVPGDEDGAGPRKLYFNSPLPSDLLDEEGFPVQQFARNKIRTAKYTPLSFIPKNLWFQFHNIANIFFLFTVILVVSAPWWTKAPVGRVMCGTVREDPVQRADAYQLSRFSLYSAA
jgi:phospholipid-translocating ATPase